MKNGTNRFACRIINRLVVWVNVVGKVKRKTTQIRALRVRPTSKQPKKNGFCLNSNTKIVSPVNCKYESFTHVNVIVCNVWVYVRTDGYFFCFFLSLNAKLNHTTMKTKNYGAEFYLPHFIQFKNYTIWQKAKRAKRTKKMNRSFIYYMRRSDRKQNMNLKSIHTNTYIYINTISMIRIIAIEHAWGVHSVQLPTDWAFKANRLTLFMCSLWKSDRTTCINKMHTA